MTQYESKLLKDDDDSSVFDLNEVILVFKSKSIQFL